MATITSGNPQFATSLYQHIMHYEHSDIVKEYDRLYKQFSNNQPTQAQTEDTMADYAKDGSSVKAHPDSGRRDGNIYYGEPKSKKEVVVEVEPVNYPPTAKLMGWASGINTPTNVGNFP